MVRPGKRFGYQAVVDRYYSDTGLVEAGTEHSTPPTAGASTRSRQKIPLDLCQGLFDQAVEQVTAQAEQLGENRWNGFRAFLAASRYLDRLFTAQSPEECERLPSRCVDEIAWRRYKKRPERSHPRRSKNSFGKWDRKSAAA